MSRGAGGELQGGRLLSTGGLGSFWKLPLTSGELRFFLRRSISAQKEDCALRALSQPWVRRVPWALPLPDVGGPLFPGCSDSAVAGEHSGGSGSASGGGLSPVCSVSAFWVRS